MNALLLAALCSTQATVIARDAQQPFVAIDGEGRVIVAFIKEGRTVDDPLNTTGVPMPPKGFNMALSDDDILAIVRYIRSLSE